MAVRLTNSWPNAVQASRFRRLRRPEMVTYKQRITEL